MGSPFARARMMMSMLAAAMSGLTGSAALARLNEMAAKLGPYESHGKRKTRSHDNGGNARARRLAVKKRNVVRNRKAQRRSAS